MVRKVKEILKKTDSVVEDKSTKKVEIVEEDDTVEKEIKPMKKDSKKSKKKVEISEDELETKLPDSPDVAIIQKKECLVKEDKFDPLEKERLKYTPNCDFNTLSNTKVAEASNNMLLLELMKRYKDGQNPQFYGMVQNILFKANDDRFYYYSKKPFNGGRDRLNERPIDRLNDKSRDRPNDKPRDKFRNNELPNNIITRNDNFRSKDTRPRIVKKDNVNDLDSQPVDLYGNF